MKRASGVLLPIFSLPSPYGIGTMGKEAFRFADFLKAAGQRYWQILPLGPTGLGNSPYTAFSTFAGNPYLIDLDLLAEDGLLDSDSIAALPWGSNPEKIDYAALEKNRFRVLYQAYERGFPREREAVQDFVKENTWLPDYALFMVAKEHFPGVAWQDWPDKGLRSRDPETLSAFAEQYRDRIRFYEYLQFLFWKQWTVLKTYVNALGIRLIGDLPIYVAMDSADTWSETQFFALGEDLVPKEVAGVPPDYFSEEGQLWGNPLYDWEAMKRDGYGWWIRRMEGTKKRV
ncbi:MAG TPA: 4-alpha-glucanotransferase, partial [Clostridiales bacterium]|nr:4-alpha-glucanotransferase [Clostridiales bacterium]